METQLLDSTHGWNGPEVFVLEQYWLLDNEEPVRITVRYMTVEDMRLYSTAELVHLDEEAVNPEAVLRLRSYPSQWWQPVALEHRSYDAPPSLLEDVAVELLGRLVELIEALTKAGRR